MVRFIDSGGWRVVQRDARDESPTLELLHAERRGGEVYGVQEALNLYASVRSASEDASKKKTGSGLLRANISACGALVVRTLPEYGDL